MKFEPKIEVARQIDRPEILFSVARHEQRLFLGASDAHVYALDLNEEKPEPSRWAGHQSYVTSVVAAGPYIVSGAYDGRLIWWDRDAGEQVCQVPAHSRWIRQLAVSPDGTRVVSVADDMLCRVWDVNRQQLIRDLRGHQARTPHHFPSMLYACAISPDGRYLATGDRIGHNVVWDLDNGRPLAELETPTLYTWDPVQRIHSIGGVRSLAFSHDARLLAIGGIGQIGNIDHLGALARVEVFDWRNGKRTHEFPGDTHKGLVERLAFGPDDQWLLAAGGDHGGFVQVLDLETAKVLKQDKAPMHVHDFVLDASARTFYAAGHGKIVQFRI